MKKLVLLLLVCVVAWPVRAQTPEFEPAHLSVDGLAAYRTLLQSNWFSIGGVGFTGQIAPEEKAFQTLAHEREAAAAFKSLLGKAKTGGQLYALLWLSLSNQEMFAREAKRFKKSEAAQQEIQTADGCILSKKPARNFIEQMEQGTYNSYATKLNLPTKANAQP